MRLSFLMSLFFLNLSLLGCQTSPHSAFDTIDLGTSKEEVLSRMGGPTRTYRKGSVDHWVYKMKTRSGGWLQKELLLQNNIVIEKQISPNSKPAPSDYEEVH